MVRQSKTKRAQKINVAAQVLLLLGVVIAVNVLFKYVHFRVDLTEDNRYTLSKTTENLLDSLDDITYVTVYLDGDLPPGFEQMSDRIREMLEEYRVYSDGKIAYEFIDPYAIAQGKERSDLFKQLQNRGLESFELDDVRNDEVVSKIVWPSAFVRKGETEIPITFLRDQLGVAPDVVLHNSIMGIEYQLSNAISQLERPNKQKIAFIAGHGELNSKQTADIARELQKKYTVERLNLPAYKVGKLREYDAIVIAKPDSAFSDVDKYKIDQYIMRGGKVLWFIETLVADMDSLKTSPSTTTLDHQLRLRDMLFKYGVRINLDLVQDYNSHKIPIFAGRGKNNANLRKWPYFPLVTPIAEHPIVENIGILWFQFANSIDTIGTSPGINKTVLLKSSANSRSVPHPHRINLQMARMNLSPSLFDKGEQNMAVLLEGKFTSFFKNKLAPSTLADPAYGVFKEAGEKEAKMIVVADGDMIANHVNSANGSIYALGYDRFTRQSFSNKAFVMNSVDYLLDESGVFKLRSKDLKMRMLQQGRVREEKTFWQAINLIVPVIILLLSGLIYNFIRKRRFAK